MTPQTIKYTTGMNIDKFSPYTPSNGEWVNVIERTITPKNGGRSFKVLSVVGKANEPKKTITDMWIRCGRIYVAFNVGNNEQMQWSKDTAQIAKDNGYNDIYENILSEIAKSEEKAQRETERLAKIIPTIEYVWEKPNPTSTLDNCTIFENVNNVFELGMVELDEDSEIITLRAHNTPVVPDGYEWDTLNRNDAQSHFEALKYAQKNIVGLIHKAVVIKVHELSYEAHTQIWKTIRSFTPHEQVEYLINNGFAYYKECVSYFTKTNLG